MDGTLTLAVHDFDAIRKELGLPEGKPILEQIAIYPKMEARRLHKQLDMIELDIAARSKPADGAAELLEALTAKGHQLGILTRNNRINIYATLEAAGLNGFFEDNNLISRNCVPPKPDPAGIHRLLNAWGGTPEESVMVGDHLFDLDTGRAAGSATIYVDPTGEFEHRDKADFC
ncbi:MAG: HAD family hydrolase, partial [uncultured Thiotrichaceae bacterium]